MSKCTRCGREMSSSSGCNVRRVAAEGKVYKRILVGDPGDISGGEGRSERCRDCNALHGRPHHWGCDSETCPACGHLLTGCGCGDVLALPGAQKTVKVVCYSRVATDDQLELDQQAWENKKYAREQGYSVVATIGEAGSGRPMNRSGIGSLTKHIESHDFDTLILRDLTRLGRNPALVLPFLKYLKEHGIRVESPTQGALGDLFSAEFIVRKG